MNPQLNEDVITSHRKVSILLGIGILIVPIIFSWFTLRKGYSNIVRVISFCWLIFVMFFVYFPHNKTTNTNKSHTTESTYSESNKEEVQKESQTSERQELHSVKNGKYIDINSLGGTSFFTWWRVANSSDKPLDVLIDNYYSLDEFDQKDTLNNERARLERELTKYEGIKYISIPIVDLKTYRELIETDSNNFAVTYTNWHLDEYNFEKQGFRIFTDYRSLCLTELPFDHVIFNTKIECFLPISENNRLPNNDRLAQIIKNLSDAKGIGYTGTLYVKLPEITNFTDKAPLEIIATDIDVRISTARMSLANQEAYGAADGHLIYQFSLGDK